MGRTAEVATLTQTDESKADSTTDSSFCEISGNLNPK